MACSRHRHRRRSRVFAGFSPVFGGVYALELGTGRAFSEVLLMSCSGCSYKGMSTAVEDGFVGVRFRDETNPTLCATSGTIYGRGEEVVVELDSGPAYGHVEQSPMPVFKPCQKAGAKRILRKATPADRSDHDRQLSNEQQAKLFCQQKSKDLGLEMKVSRVDFALSSKEAIFYFTSEGRVD